MLPDTNATAARNAAPIVLIGGTNGTGKTRLASQLSTALGLEHRLGTGFIREIVRAETTPEREPLLFRYSFEPPDPVSTLRWQARRLLPAVVACINRARAEGTSLVIEGTHLIPELYAGMRDVDSYIILKAPTAAGEHYRRLHGDSHATRQQLSDQEVEATLTVDRYYASRGGIPAVEYSDNLDAIIALLRLSD